MLKGDYRKDQDVLHAMLKNGHGNKTVSELRFYDDVWSVIEEGIYNSLNKKSDKEKES